MALTTAEAKALDFARSIQRNCRQCTQCGAITCNGDKHDDWHAAVKAYVDTLRADATAAIQTANARTDQVRTDATAAIQSANQKITALTNRVTALELRLPAV